MNMLIRSQQLTKCGGIYVNPEDKLFVLDCLFCNKEYCEWLEFISHIQGDHLKEFLNTNNKKWIIERVKTVEEKRVEKYENVKEHLQEDLNKVLENEQCIFENENLMAIDSLENVSQEILIDLRNNAVDDSNEDCILEEYLLESEEDNEINNRDLETNVDVQITPLNTENRPKSINTCFFRLTTTDSSIMLKFIELLRHHPCQWNHKHQDYANKEKRTKSSFQLTEQLKEFLNLNLTPRGTRSSVLTLLRWFDQEYLRFLRCEKKDLQFICVRSEYFEKLLEFLPYKHLQPMTCHECFKHFKSEHLLMAHNHKHHNGKIPFLCRYCGRGFIHQSSHKMHENRHIKIQLWPCRTCLYQATSKADYLKHLDTTHSTKRPFKCDICGLVYKTSSNLNVHKKSHSLPKYECEFCKRKFYEKYRYKRHIWLHEKKAEAPRISLDDFSCQICGRRFTSNKTLMKHKLVHKEENYGLNVASCSKQELKNDILTVGDYCDYCSLEFINKEAYKTHMNLKHNIM